jgi:hypothetical protein
VGAAAAALGLTVSALLPAAIILLAVARRRMGQRGCSVALAVVVVALGAWALRNAVAGGRLTPFTLVSTGGPLYAAVETQIPTDSQVRAIYRQWEQQWSPDGIPLSDAMQVDRDLTEASLGVIAVGPVSHLRHQMWETAEAWWRPAGVIENCDGTRATRPVILAFIISATVWQRLVIVLAALGTLCSWRRRATRIALGLVCLVTFTYAPLRVETRYLLPVLPAMSMLAGASLLALPGRRGSGIFNKFQSDVPQEEA